MIFYVLIFGLLAVFVIVAAVMKMRGRRPGRASSESGPSSGVAGHSDLSIPGHGAHHVHPTEAARRNRKAKRVESRRDRRKRK
jgi:hypothetical protein